MPLNETPTSEKWYDDDIYKYESDASPGGNDQYFIPAILSEYRRRMKNEMNILVQGMKPPSSMTPDRKAAYSQAIAEVARRFLKL